MDINTLAVGLTVFLGVAGTYITQFVKNTLRLEGRAAATLNLGISFVLGFGTVALTTDMDALDSAAAIGSIFTLTTLAYNYLVKGTSAEGFGSRAS